MTAPAAFQATYSDFKLIKGRKCAQIILEVDIERADAALEALGGVPQPHRETWVGVARIDLGVAQSAERFAVTEDVTGSSPVSQANGSPDTLRYGNKRSVPVKEPRSWSDLSYAQQAGIRCNEPVFWSFINDEFGALDAKGIKSPEGAATFVRMQCGVASRADITHGSFAGNDWLNLNDKYEAWKREREYR